MSSPPVLVGFVLLFSFICMFCKSLFVLLSVFLWPLFCLSFDIRVLITPLYLHSSYHRICNYSNLTGVTCGEGTAYPPGVPSLPSVFSGVHVTRALVFFVVFCRSMFFLLFFFVWLLCCLPFFVWLLCCLSFFVWLLCCLPFFVWLLCCLPFFVWLLCCLSFFDLRLWYFQTFLFV